MIPINKKIIIVSFLTFIVSVAIFQVHNAGHLKNEKLFSFPMEIGDWHGEDIPMEDWVFKSLETPYAILRDYHLPEGETVNLAIVWYDDKEIAFHAPEACLGGVGNKVKENNTYNVSIDKDQDLRIGRIIAERDNTNLLVLYYFVNDGYITPSQVGLRASVLMKRLRFQRTSAAFIRIMAPIKKEQGDTLKVLEQFLRTSLLEVNRHTNTDNI